MPTHNTSKAAKYYNVYRMRMNSDAGYFYMHTFQTPLPTIVLIGTVLSFIIRWYLWAYEMYAYANILHRAWCACDHAVSVQHIGHV